MPTIMRPDQMSGRRIPPPALRVEPTTPDGDDSRRIAWGKHLWSSQDDLLRHRNQQIEENIRMLAGQHYVKLNAMLGKWLDPAEWLTDAENRWQQRPVFNRLMNWFILTHARLTENPPVITFLPGPDRIDQQLAETLDVAFKTIWREANMTDVVDRLMAWLIPGGRAHLLTRIDLQGGAPRPWVGSSPIPVVDEYGNPMIGPDGQPEMDEFPDAEIPFDQDGNPLARSVGGQLEITGEPHIMKEGRLVVDVLSALEARGEWGPKPWHEKAWHAMVSYLSPEEVYEQYQMDVQPDSAIDNTGSELERALFGGGYFAAASGKLQAQAASPRMEGLVEVRTIWHRPTPEWPEGRMLVFTNKTVLTDGPRPIAFPYTSPLRCFDFVRIPGRPSGTSPQEMLNSPSRAYNRGWAQILMHRNLVSNPIAVVDQASGIANQWTNEPGARYEAVLRPGVSPVVWIQPPALGEDVYKAQGLLLQELLDLGNLQGTQGDPPSIDPSGELIKELRFNSDRFLGPTVRRAVEEFGRMAEDWMAMLPVIWDEEKILQYTGEDNVARTISVLPDMFTTGKVNVVPDVESMLPEGRSERQSRVLAMYNMGLLGIPGSPEARKRFFEQAHFPHLSRVGQPGGVDQTMAEQENGKLMQGHPAESIPVFPWYDHMVHLMVHEQFMKSPEFLELDPVIQEQFADHWEFHMTELAMQSRPAVDENGQPLPAGNGGPPEGNGGPPPPGGGPPPAGGGGLGPEPAAQHAPASVDPASYPTGGV